MIENVTVYIYMDVGCVYEKWWVFMRSGGCGDRCGCGCGGGCEGGCEGG